MTPISEAMKNQAPSSPSSTANKRVVVVQKFAYGNTGGSSSRAAGSVTAIATATAGDEQRGNVRGSGACVMWAPAGCGSYVGSPVRWRAAPSEASSPTVIATIPAGRRRGVLRSSISPAPMPTNSRAPQRISRRSDADGVHVTTK
jgi:hypothetical protein